MKFVIRRVGNWNAYLLAGEARKKKNIGNIRGVVVRIPSRCVSFHPVESRGFYAGEKTGDESRGRKKIQAGGCWNHNETCKSFRGRKRNFFLFLCGDIWWRGTSLLAVNTWNYVRREHWLTAFSIPPFYPFLSTSWSFNVVKPS